MPTDARQLRTVIATALARAAEMEPPEIRDDLNLFDIGLDSLSLAAVMIDIEDAVGAELPSEVLDRFLAYDEVVTIRDVVDVLSAWDPTAADPLGSHGVVIVDQS